jgi:hypothetical protein
VVVEEQGLSSQRAVIPKSTLVIATLSRHHASVLCAYTVRLCDCAYCASFRKSVCVSTPACVGTKASVVILSSANFM